jgi:hypothetical protein
VRDTKSRSAQGPEVEADAEALARHVQLIEFQTSQLGDVVAVLRKLLDTAQSEGARAKAEIRKDRDRHDRYVWVLRLHDGPDAATAGPISFERLAAHLGPYIDGPPVVRNLVLIDDDSYALGDQMSVRASRAT